LLNTEKLEGNLVRGERKLVRGERREKEGRIDFRKVFVS